MAKKNAIDDYHIQQENARLRKVKLTEENMILKRLELDQRNPERCLINRLNEERRQAEEEEKMAKTKESEKWISKEYIQEEALAHELDKLNREELRDIKYRQQLLESPEIRDLQLQLRTAYARKELASQIEIKKLKKLEEEYSDRTYSEETDMVAKELELKQREEEFKRKEEYRKCLQDQMINKYKLKQEEYKEFLKEKALIDDALRTVMEEDQIELEQKLLKKKLIKEDIESFKKAKALWMLKVKEAEEKEERQRREYIMKKAEQELKMKQTLNCKQDNLEKAKQIVADIITHNQGTKDEKEKIIQMVIEEEDRQKADERKCEENMKILKGKIDFRENIKRQIEEKIFRLKEEKDQEIEYTNQKLKEIEEHQKIEQMTKEKQKLMKLEMRLEVKKELEERELRRQKEVDDLHQWRQFQMDEITKNRARLEEERIKLLKEHAFKLVGYLPKGVLKPSDLPHLPPDVQQFYKKDAEPIGNPQR